MKRRKVLAVRLARYGSKLSLEKAQEWRKRFRIEAILFYRKYGMRRIQFGGGMDSNCFVQLLVVVKR